VPRAIDGHEPEPVAPGDSRVASTRKVRFPRASGRRVRATVRVHGARRILPSERRAQVVRREDVTWASRRAMPELGARSATVTVSVQRRVRAVHVARGTRTTGRATSVDRGRGGRGRRSAAGVGGGGGGGEVPGAIARDRPETCTP
jgi:hypothetical protein